MLVLSIFPGIDLLGRAFEEEGFTVVRGPDPIFGGDVRTFHPPRGRFDGVIGGPPCQAHSSLAPLRKSQGKAPSFPDMNPEFIRVVAEARPPWFLWENVRRAPAPEDLALSGYLTQVLLLNNRHLGAAGPIGPVQNRVRQFCFGSFAGLKIRPEFAVFDNPEKEWAVLGSELRAGAQPVKYRNGGKCVGGAMKSKRTLERICELQGLPRSFDVPGWTVEGKGRAIGNGVPLPMGRAMARAIKNALDEASNAR